MSTNPPEPTAAWVIEQLGGEIRWEDRRGSANLTKGEVDCEGDLVLYRDEDMEEDWCRAAFANALVAAAYQLARSHEAGEWEEAECFTCEGTGKVDAGASTPFEDDPALRRVCDQCSGHGTIRRRVNP